MGADATPLGAWVWSQCRAAPISIRIGRAARPILERSPNSADGMLATRNAVLRRRSDKPAFSAALVRPNCGTVPSRNFGPVFAGSILGLIDADKI